MAEQKGNKWAKFYLGDQGCERGNSLFAAEIIANGRKQRFEKKGDLTLSMHDVEAPTGTEVWKQNFCKRHVPEEHLPFPTASVQVVSVITKVPIFRSKKVRKPQRFIST